jgi:hypothetical protein
MSAHVPHFKARVVTVFLLVAVPVLVLGVVLVLALGQARLRDGYGQHLAQVAQQTATSVDTYVLRRVLDLSQLARTPELRRAAQASSAQPFDRASVRQADLAWRAGQTAPPSGAAAAALEARTYLSDTVAFDGTYRELLLTDRVGRLVAASRHAEGSWFGDEDWWQAVTGDGGRGRTSMTDVRWDPRTKSYTIEIAVPVPEASGEALAGVLRVVADSPEMLAAVGGVTLGTTGQAVLLREDGSIAFSPRPVDRNARFFASEPLREHLAALASGRPGVAGHFRAEAGGEPRVVGVARTSLQRQYPNIGWVVAVSQAEAELLAPVRVLGWYLLAVLALLAVAVLAVALYFSERLTAPTLDVDMDLVEHPHPATASHIG